MEKKITTVRIDKWLWCVRIFKTRSMASQYCDKGKIKIKGDVIKPSRNVKPGDIVTFQDGALIRTFEVLMLLDSRVGAKDVFKYCKETTPEETLLQHAALRKAAAAWRMPGAGRPTKKERRELDYFIWGEDIGEI